jgi:hypothetical protein
MRILIHLKQYSFGSDLKRSANPKGQGVLHNVEAKLLEQHLELKILGCHSLEQGCSLAPHMNMHN